MRILIFLFFAFSLYAHQSGLSFLELEEQSDHNVNVTYKKPLSDTRVSDIRIEYPQNCLSTSKQSVKIINGFIIKKYTLYCGQKGLSGSRIWVKGLVYSDRGILIRYQKGDFVKKAVLRDTSPFISLDKKQNYFELVKEYVELGIFHILSGYDHLMFVTLLFLLSRNLKSLLFTISAFTLSHSITLTCGILGIVYMPPPFIESMIALSIIFLAKELLIEGETFTKRHLGVVAFSFGLLHGFGFSSALRDIGLPQDEIPLSLFSFNVGIELGQILFILCVSIIVVIFTRLGVNVKQYYKHMAYFVGVIASFWFIQRVFSF